MSFFFPSLKKSKTDPVNRGFTGDPWNNKDGSPFLKMSKQEKRALYKCGDHYETLESVPLWPLLYKFDKYKIIHRLPRKGPAVLEEKACSVNREINNKISLWQGDITKLEIDAIVNAANQSLMGGGGVDGCIHRNAGSTLKKECSSLNGCNTGQAKITSGHRLPAKYIIHTVGPVGKSPSHLQNCYENCLQLAKENEIRSIAFCCISTGVYGYPNKDAAYVALRTVRAWMENNHQQMDRIIFCTFLAMDFQIYEELMATLYFPCEDTLKDERDLQEASTTREENDLLDMLDAAPSVPDTTPQPSKQPVEHEDASSTGSIDDDDLPKTQPIEDDDLPATQPIVDESRHGNSSQELPEKREEPEGS